MVIIKGNSYCKLKSYTPIERKLVTTSLTYNDEEKHKQSIYLKKAYSKAKAAGQLKKAGYLVGIIKQLGDFNVCLVNKDDTFPAGLLFKVKELWDKAKASPKYVNQIGTLTIEDDRVQPEPYNIFRWENIPPPMRYYQEECLKIAMEKHRGTFNVCVGGGKTLLASNIIKQTGVNTLFVVPSNALSQQTYNVFSRYFGTKNVQMINSKDIKAKKKLKPILISTVQTLASLVKQGEITHITDHIHSLMLDESHHAASESYLKLLPYLNEVYYRFNFTGTYTRNDSKIMELWGICDELLYKYNAAQATKDGFLTPVEFKIKTLNGTPHNNYNTEYHTNYSSKVFMNAVIQCVKNITTDKQILILVDRKDLVGQQIQDWLKIAGYKSVYVTGDNDKKELAKAMQDFNEKKNRILIASTVLGEGADITSTDVLIMARGGKSEIAVTQAIGRAVRLAPGKIVANVIDFYWVGPKWLGKHTKLRIDTYVEEFAGKIIQI